MNQRHLHAFIERITQGRREMPRMSRALMTTIGRWFGRAADNATRRRPDAPSGQIARTRPARPTRPSVRSFTTGPLWRGPAAPVPEHVRQHGIPFQSIGIDASPAPKDDMRDALAAALERITVLEQRQGALAHGVPPGDGSCVPPVATPSHLA